MCERRRRAAEAARKAEETKKAEEAARQMAEELRKSEEAEEAARKAEKLAEAEKLTQYFEGQAFDHSISADKVDVSGAEQSAEQIASKCA
jgi:hypothetical protein